MKTPKRTPWQHTTEPCTNQHGALRCCINEQHSRWKRKNRISQYKRTIARLTAENKRLWDGFSRMSKSCCDLYNRYVFKN